MENPDHPKAGLLNRAVAGMIDLIVVAALSGIPNIGLLASMLYVLIKDGFSGGQSLGKRLVGIKTLVITTDKDAGFRESIIRNTPLLIARILWIVPIIGWLCAGAVILFESMLVVGSLAGKRFGDELADTQIVEAV